jgi:hypothetical protein
VVSGGSYVREGGEEVYIEAISAIEAARAIEPIHAMMVP